MMAVLDYLVAEHRLAIDHDNGLNIGSPIVKYYYYGRPMRQTDN